MVNHALRPNYKAGMWKKCLEQDTKVPDPVGRELAEEDGQFYIEWVVSQQIRKFKNCLHTLFQGSANYSLPTCKCMVNGLKYTRQS